MNDHDQSYTLHPDVVVTELDGENESVLLHLGTKKYYTLNETGVRIWQLLGQGDTIGQVVRNICKEYKITSTSAEKSVGELVQHLLDEELLSQV